MGRAPRDAHRHCLCFARLHFGICAYGRRRRRLETGLRLSPDDAVPRLVRRRDGGHGRSLSDRLRRTGIRSRRLPCRRDQGSQPQRAARHVCRGIHGWHLFHRPPHGVARRPRLRSVGIGPRYGARPHLRAAAREFRQGGRRLVHHAQHVPRHASAFGGSDTNDVPACRRWAPAPLPLPPLQADRLPLGRHRAHRRFGHRLPGYGRSCLDDRGRQFHLSHRHLHAEHRGLATAARHAGRGPSLPRSARHHCARRARRLDLAARRHPWLPAIRPSYRRFRARLGLFRSRPWRVMEDRVRDGLPAIAQTLHVKLTGAMVLVLILDGIAYLAAVNTISASTIPSWCRFSPTSSSPWRC